MMAADWREIIQRIQGCRRIKDVDEKIKCLKSLLEETKDGMVAYALAEELENIGILEEALKYYEEAKVRFPIIKYKKMADNAAARVREKIASLEHKMPLVVEADATALEELNLENFDPAETLLIVSCTKLKIWDVSKDAPKYVPARFAYAGKAFRKFVEMMEQNAWEEKGFRWVILSAKYGYIEPWHPISNYNVTFDDENTGPISDETLYRQVMFHHVLPEIRLKDFKTIICLGSPVYLEKIKKSFKDTTCQIIPLKIEVEQPEKILPRKKSLSLFFKSFINNR